jgi:biopolymer transport protein ExbD
MLDVMVILVFFLIFTAVFSRTNILELTLPPPSADAPPLPPQLELEVIIRRDRVEVADKATGPLKTLPIGANGYDYEGLTDFLKVIKAKFPDKTSATLLLEPEVPYDILVQMMDAVRTFDAGHGTRHIPVELFPDISIGDAPT